MLALFLVILFVHPAPPLLDTGRAAPPIVLRDAAGGSVDVYRRANHRPVVIQFFATTCPTCRRQAAALCAMQADFSAVTVVGVDAAREPADKLRAFQQRYLPAGCSVTLLADPGARVSQQYAITVVPTLYVVDGNGKIAAAGFGETTVEPARRLLERLLHG